MTSSNDAAVRLGAFQFLDEAHARHGNALPRDLLVAGFQWNGRRVPLLGPSGIFKPALCELPLSFTTVPVVEGKPRPYEDQLGDDVIHYRYRGEDPQHRDNVGMRTAMSRQIPLIYFFGIQPGSYATAYPAFVVGDDPTSLTFRISIDDRRFVTVENDRVAEPETARRLYVTRTTQYRLHQQSFRERVLRAYQERCSVCRLRREALLDAAHILPDGHPKGEPWVSNGLALCKLHHAAFDQHFIGIRPDLIVEVRADILDESDGPMLDGLRACHGKPLGQLPRETRLHPNRDYLEERFEAFRRSV